MRVSGQGAWNGGGKLSRVRRMVRGVGLADWLELACMALVTVNYVAFPKRGRRFRYLAAILATGTVAIIA